MAGVTVLGLLAGCSGGGGSGNAAGPGATQTSGVTITVAYFMDSPPQAALDEFKKESGITVKWSNIDFDSLQTKIAAAATAKTYFADATDVDWSRVGQVAKLNWFYPINQFIDTKALAPEMPQLSSFTAADGKVVAVPLDAAFLVTTTNKKLFARAGITKNPTTIGEYTNDLKQIKAKGLQYPLNIPFAAAEGLSTYWYQTTAAFGGTVLDGKGKPQFTTPDSAGYKAAQFMVDAIMTGLVPPGNINVSDSQGQQTLMAKGAVASTFADYSGNIGSLYDVPASSSVVKDVQYLPTPGVTGPGVNVGNPDGIGVPRTAKYPAAAAKFIQWFTSAKNQADFAGVSGPDKVWAGYFIPSRTPAVAQLTAKGTLIGGAQLSALLKTARPVFPQGAPSYYPEFSRAAYTNLHAAATGSITVEGAVKAIADAANRLSGS
jgi:ABC-type glycerol-3-phosphate transport system substrate-binding protein